MKDFAKWTKKLTQGAFLTSFDESETNCMTISWGFFGFAYGEECAVVMVRKSRHTNPLIHKTQKFSITLPKEKLQKELSFCGTRSGEVVNKIKECGFKTKTSKAIPYLDIAGEHIICEVINCFEQSENSTCSARKFYETNDYHDVIVAKIINTIKED